MPRNGFDEPAEMTKSAIAKDEKFNEFYSGSQMWAVSGGDSYFPCAKTESKLPPAQYIINYSEAKGIFFTRKEINLDKLLVLPDSKAEKVLASIDHFWSCEAKFREHGFLWKRGIMLWGPPGCLAADTHIAYSSYGPDGNRRSHKGASIERLYQVFNGLTGPGKGRYQKAPEDSIFFVSSVDDEGRVFRNRILDVVKSGQKECFEVITESGKKIVATATHKFNNGEIYVELQNLKVGDSISVHDGKVVRKYPKTESNFQRKYLYVKNHPIAGTKVVDGKYTYKRLARARAVMEAVMNGLSFDDYIEKLNSGDFTGLIFLERTDNVHHKDENFTNDDISNLEIVDHVEHATIHGCTSNALAYEIYEEKIISIKYVGVKETYDLRMAAPYSNFIAQKFVVHNSGKTVLCQQLSSQIVKNGGISVYLSEPKFTAEGLRVLRLIEPKRPIVVMIEDIDAIVERNGESNLLALLDGELQIDNVVFVATTNYPEKLDKRLVNRPSRFDEIIKIGMPSDAAREQYLKHKVPRLYSSPEELKAWVAGTKEFSIAHLRESIISVECLGNDLNKTLKRLIRMNQIKVSSEDSGNKIGFTGGFENLDD